MISPLAYFFLTMISMFLIYMTYANSLDYCIKISEDKRDLNTIRVKAATRVLLALLLGFAAFGLMFGSLLSNHTGFAELREKDPIALIFVWGFASSFICIILPRGL